MAAVQPKKPVGGSFGQFVAANRPRFMEACKGQEAKGKGFVAKMASAEWKEVSDAEKAKWQKKYEEMKVQYAKDWKAFEDAGGVKAPRQPKGQKGKWQKMYEEMKVHYDKDAGGVKAPRKGEKSKLKKKDANAPKRPAGGAFGQFKNATRPQFRQECAGQPIAAVTEKAREKWRTLSDTEKKPYEEAYEKAAEEYKKAMEEYKENGGADDEEEDDEEGEDEPEKPPRKKRAVGA